MIGLLFDVILACGTVNHHSVVMKEVELSPQKTINVIKYPLLSNLYCIITFHTLLNATGWGGGV